ncbi:MAG: chromate transporter, chromate ion transporter family [Polaromonas sp.]|nr:chromate transporter, chromate ion transporter family [Polaromonas sp.]
MVLPGREAQQLATYFGWLMHKTWGGVVAGIFYGIKPAVAAIVLHAVHRIASKALPCAVQPASARHGAGGGLWLLLTAANGWSGTLTQIGWFFTKAALLTFGGAYAVLPYVNQAAVEHYQWLSTAQMMDGLALGETTPGPLIIVVAFVGFVGGWTQQVLGPDALFLGPRWLPAWRPGLPSCPRSSLSWRAGCGWNPHAATSS